MPASLQLSLLYKIMQRLGEAREHSAEWVSNTALYDLLPGSAQPNGKQKALVILNRHLKHLSERGYVETGSQTHEGSCAVWLTSQGNIFLQPELPEFGAVPMFPAVVQSIEQKIAVLTYPDEEKEGMLFRLREAIAKRAPEVIAKVIVELSSKILTGGA
jgi:hypothetical protein